jgi:hypothetical protein
MNSNHALDIVTNSATRMTIGPAGNVTINAPSSGTALTVVGSIAPLSSGGGNLGGSTLPWAEVQARSFNVRRTDNTLVGYMTDDVGVALNALGSELIRFVTNASTRMTIGPAGNVTINAPSSGAALTVDGPVQINDTNKLSFTNTPGQTYIHASASNTLTFGTNAVERLSIDPSGVIEHRAGQFNVLPGAGLQYEFVNRNGDGFNFYGGAGQTPAGSIRSPGVALPRWNFGALSGTGGSLANFYFDSIATQTGASFLDARTGATSSSTMYFYRNGAYVGSIETTDVGTAYTTGSDYRLKNITGDLRGSGAFIDALQPREGTWKSSGNPFAGFVAHELADACPSAVAGEKDGEKMQSVSYAAPELIANVVAELKSLRARVAVLEA